MSFRNLLVLIFFISTQHFYSESTAPKILTVTQRGLRHSNKIQILDKNTMHNRMKVCVCVLKREPSNTFLPRPIIHLADLLCGGQKRSSSLLHATSSKSLLLFAIFAVWNLRLSIHTQTHAYAYYRPTQPTDKQKRSLALHASMHVRTLTNNSFQRGLMRNKRSKTRTIFLAPSLG